MRTAEAVNSAKWMAAGHVIMGDATRSKAFGEEKTQPMRFESWYCLETGEISARVAWPDCQVVKGETALDNLTRMHKQIRLVQCCAFDVAEAVKLGPRQLRILWLIGENGSDQLFYRPMVAERIKPTATCSSSDFLALLTNSH